MSRRKRAYKRKTGPVSPESSTPAKLSSIEKQKNYRHRQRIKKEYPNLHRLLEARREKLKADPVYQLKERERRLARRRLRRKKNPGINGAPSKVARLVPRGSRMRPAGLVSRPGNAGVELEARYVGHPREPLPDLRPLESMYALGLSDAEIAKVMGVSVETWERWIRFSPSLRASVKKGKEIADSKVVASLYRQALGYTVPDEKIFYDKDKGRAVRVPIEKHVQPSTVAGIFWLKNRQAEFWRDRKEIDHKGDAAGGITREVKIVLVAPSGDKSEDNQDQVIDADFRVLPALEDKSGEKSG